MAKAGPSTVADRINRVQGQIQGIERMINEEQDINLVITQIKAAVSSLESLRLELVKLQIKEKIVQELDGVVGLLR